MRARPLDERSEARVTISPDGETTLSRGGWAATL